MLKLALFKVSKFKKIFQAKTYQICQLLTFLFYTFKRMESQIKFKENST